MAKKNNTATAPTKPSSSSFDDFEGQVIVEELDAVWAKEPGAVIRGTISHAYSYLPKRKNADGERHPVIGLAIRTDAPCEGMQDGDVYTFDPGALVGVTLGKKLQDLVQYAVGSRLAIRADREVDIGGGQRCWSYTVKADGKKNPRGSDIRPTVSMHQAPPDVEPEPEGGMTDEQLAT